MSLSEYPFTRKAVDRVKETGYTLDDLLERRGLRPVRKRALSRIIEAIKGEIEEVSAHPLAELLSYPLARAMISCVDDDFLIRRYALAESKLASSKMRGEDLCDLTEIAHDLNVHPIEGKSGFELHFTEYLKAAHMMHSTNWKLVNRPLRDGWVAVTSQDLVRLLEERVREDIQRGLPIQVPSEICEKLADYSVEIREELAATRSDERIDLGEVTQDAFPPCIMHMLMQVAGGVNLAHTARFALTSFLLQVGMSTDEVVQIFNNSPDFDEDRTRYQVEHISGKSGTSYKPPSCATMLTYGNCPGEDALCKWVNHPLNYYRRRLRRKAEEDWSAKNP